MENSNIFFFPFLPISFSSPFYYVTFFCLRGGCTLRPRLKRLWGQRSYLIQPWTVDTLFCVYICVEQTNCSQNEPFVDADYIIIYIQNEPLRPLFASLTNIHHMLLLVLLPSRVRRILVKLYFQPYPRRDLMIKVFIRIKFSGHWYIENTRQWSHCSSN